MTQRTKSVFQKDNPRNKLAELYIDSLSDNSGMYFTIKSFMHGDNIFEVKVPENGSRSYNLSSGKHIIGYDKFVSFEILRAANNGHSKLIINGKDEFDIYYRED